MRKNLFYVCLMWTTLAKAQFPAFQWANVPNGSGNLDNALAVAVDRFGNVYTTGNFSGVVDFDPGPGTYTLASMGFQDVFISKTDCSGNFIWVRGVGGAQSERGFSIDVDPKGNVYVSGEFTSTTDFDPGPAAVNVTPASANINDAFVLKLDVTGNFVWVKTFGGSQNEYAYGVAVDALSNVYVAGYYNDNAPFNMGSLVVPASYSLMPNGNSNDIFVSKIDDQGNFVWVRTYGGPGDDAAYSIDLDAQGNPHVTGRFEGPVGFTPGPGSNILSAQHNGFVLKLDNLGNCQWAKNMGGASYAEGRALDVDPWGNVYTAGTFEQTGDFDPGPGTATLSCPNVSVANTYVSKLDVFGNFVWVDGLSGINQFAHAISADTLGQVFISGSATGGFGAPVDFDPGPGVFNLSSNAPNKFYLLELNSSGSFVAATLLDLLMLGSDVASDRKGNVYVAGSLSGPVDLDFGPGTYTPGANSVDIFTLKMGTNDCSIIGMEELGKKGAYALYPNPTSSKLIIKTEPLQNVSGLEIINCLGQTVLKLKPQSETTVMDISELATGAYFVRIMDGAKILAAQKLLKN